MLYHSLNFHIVTVLCKQTPIIFVFLTSYDPLSIIMIVLSRYCPNMKWRDNGCMAFNFISMLPCWIDLLPHISVKPNLICHYYISCLSFSLCHFNSGTKLCIFILVTAFQQLRNLLNLHLLTVSLHLVFSSIPQQYSPLPMWH